MAKLRETWQPPVRPEWVTRVNEEGRAIDARGVVPLDENSLIATARTNTGLSDFGSDDWIEPFRVLLRSLEDEADLNLMGRILTRSEILMLLEARLGIEDWYKRHPEIADEVIDAPFLIIGQGRSGTSFTQMLLECDPDNASLQTWEAMLPVPPPETATYATDPRIAVADARIRAWNRVNPVMEGKHELSGTIPVETIALQGPSFQSGGWLVTLGQLPSYNAFMETQGMAHALAYEKRFLKLLQWRNPRKRWVMKSPDYLRYLPDVLTAFPDVRLIWNHRDPVKALGSMVDMMGTIFWMRSDTIRMAGAMDYLTDPQVSAAALSGPIDLIEDGTIPQGQLCNVLYGDLVADPMGTVERIYATFGLDLEPRAREAIGRHIADNPRSARPVRTYATADLQDSPERRAYRRYQSYFAIPNET
jgi:hypothetical protein